METAATEGLEFHVGEGIGGEADGALGGAEEDVTGVDLFVGFGDEGGGEEAVVVDWLGAGGGGDAGGGGNEPLQVTIELGAFGEDVGAVGSLGVEPPDVVVFGFCRSRV